MGHTLFPRCLRPATVAVAALVCWAIPAAGQYKAGTGSGGGQPTAQTALQNARVALGQQKLELSQTVQQGKASTAPNETATIADGQEAHPQKQTQQSDHTQPTSPPPQNQDGRQDSVSQAGIVMGTITDVNDMPVSGALVALQDGNSDEARSVTTNENGFFEFRDVVPGRPYQVSIRAAGFAKWDSPVLTLGPGQSKILDVSRLQIEEVQTSINVTPEDSNQIAVEQVKTEEKQRGLGILPNFYAVTPPIPRRLTRS